MQPGPAPAVAVVNRGDEPVRQIRLLMMSGLLAGVIVPAARAADTTSAADRTFVGTVSQGGLFEVKLGELAEDKGEAQDIKDQGATEAHDHKMVNAKLKSIASAGDIDITDDLNPIFQHQLDDLKGLSGTAFDVAYLEAMKVIHAKDGAAFAAEAKGGTDPKLRGFAAETHRIVESHIGELDAESIKTGD